MHAVRQSCRPKHQILILKCYPRYQKNPADIKPNSSELSYLLYYDSTRRSKLQKVGSFLERKTAVDVHKGKIGNVQVTLQILAALIEKIPRDLPLYAAYVLRALGTILRSRDLTLVEDSIPTFQTFCKFHDVATLAADQDHIARYEDVVRLYTTFAGQKPYANSKGGVTAPMAVRWRNAGLHAIKSITGSETVGADGGRQLNAVMPMILRNLASERESYLGTLQQKSQVVETADQELAMKRRMSLATVRTSEPSPEIETKPMSPISESTDDADRLAEEEVGLLAFTSLKQIFTANNRGQIRMGTSAMLRFICSKPPEQRPTTARISRSGTSGDWATDLVELVARWVPVQDRFIILVTIMETLIRSPMAEENLEQQILLVSLVDWLLRSNLNMIGLSTMDVLLGLVQHILLLLQLGGKGSNVLPHHQQTDAIDLFQDTKDLINQPSAKESDVKALLQGEESSPSKNRQELLTRMQKCIGNLATHIYYSDQISDMVIAILSRLKPSHTSISTDAAAIEDPEATARVISISANLRENPSTDDFFSFGTARVTALKAIKEVLMVANMKGSTSVASATGRTRLGVHVWEGTQWLLRDEDRRVRRAYVDALLVWLRLEMSQGDLRVMEDKRALLRSPSKIAGEGGRWDHLSRKALSNASQKDKAGKPTRSTFLQLLHLAVYDNAIDSPDEESDVLLLHLLLFNLVEKLGVNAVKTGLPMIMRLQEDINVHQAISSPTAKIKIGSLVHGYFCILSEKFDFETTTIGYVVHHEISRRKSHKLWLNTIRLPPLPLDQIMAAPTLAFAGGASQPAVEGESLKPFDARPAMVEQIAESYGSGPLSPPASPPSSPGRAFSVPILTTPHSPPSKEKELPGYFKEAMLSDWSKDMCIAEAEKSAARTASLNGSRGASSSTRKRYLGLDSSGVPSPNGARTPENGNDSQENSLPQSNTYPPQRQEDVKGRRYSGNDGGSPTPISSSDHDHTLRVEDLKRVLAGGKLLVNPRGASPLRNTTTRHDLSRSISHHSISASSESVADAEGFESASEGDLSQPIPPPVPAPIPDTFKPTINDAPSASRPTSFSRPRTPASRPTSSRDSDPHKPSTPRSVVRPSSSSSSANEDPTANAAALRGDPVGSAMDQPEEEVPPVPPLPASVALQKQQNVGIGAARTDIPRSDLATMRGEIFQTAFSEIPSKTIGPDARPSTAGSELGNRAKHGGRGGSLSRKKKRGVDVEALLGSIDAVAGGSRSSWGPGKPPY